MKLRILLVLFVLLTPLLALCKTKPEQLPAVSPVLTGYGDEEIVESRLTERGPHRIEGIWQFLADGSKIAIERNDESEGLEYRIVVIRSSNRLLRPGTLIGNLLPTGKNNIFQATVYSSDADGGKLRLPKTYTLTLGDEDSRLIFSKVKSRYKINLWRLVPYMWRGVIRSSDGDSQTTEGCVKIFPDPSKPVEPRYL
ncbi:MAG: hypothetical protein J1E38_09825 [Paramuribaculum sp.]|nr:hypothetical protein [Paramuribaculum sp.]